MFNQSQLTKMNVYTFLAILLILVGVDGVPVITSITPGGVILSGGISMTISGSGLTDNTQPKVVITATFTPDNNTAITETFTGLSCSVIATNSLVCPSPKITLTKFTDAGYVIPTDNKIRNLNDSRLSFNMGVTFTGFTNLVSYQPVSIYKDPVVTMENPKRTYTVWTNRIVNIYGTDLDKFVTDKNGYEILISNLRCPPMYLNSTFMWCLLPTTTPIPNDPDKLHSLVILKVGDYTQQIGRLWYRVPIFVDNTAGEPQVFIPNDKTDTISINGTNFMIAITTPDVYRIQIGQGECTNIQLSATEIKCRPPNLQPLPLTNYPQRGNLSQIVITVPKVASTAAHQYTQHVGYVQYSDRIITTTTTASPSGDNDNNNNLLGPNSWSSIWKWVLLAIAFFLGIVFLVCLCCCFCCGKDCRKNRRGWQKNKESEDSSYTERNGSAHSSFKSYPSKSASTYLDSDGSRFYHVTDERMPASRYYSNITKMRY